MVIIKGMEPNKKRGRIKGESKKLILDATAHLIAQKDASQITVRDICQAANVSTGTFYHFFSGKDALMMTFVTSDLLPSEPLMTPLSDPGGRQFELYERLISRYMSFGLDFLTSFYTASNPALKSYMNRKNGKFNPDTIMAYSQQELAQAIDAGYLCGDPHQMALDLCTIVKGTVFEACLEEDPSGILEQLERLIRRYLQGCQP